MAMEYLIDPGLTIAAIIAVWRMLHADINRVNDRIDKHLDGHP